MGLPEKNTFLRRIKRFFFSPLFPLIVITFVLAFTNYQSGVFLTGWDDLHSEFNLAQHFTRSIFSVWQEYQALGTLIGVGDATDIPRLVYLWILSWVLPLNSIRYVFHFSMLLVGTIGVYVVIKNFFINRIGRISEVASFFGALFYLLNLGTMQYFATPLEPFSVFWGMFPWLLWGILRYFQNPNSKNLIIFAFLNLLATPMYYVPTVFYVYVIVLLIVYFNIFIKMRNKHILQHIIVSFLVFICVNAFWLFPHVYWVIHNRTIQEKAISNIIATKDTYQQAQQFGNIYDFMLFRNKPWGYIDFTISNQQYLLQPWHSFLMNPYILFIGYGFFVLALLGIFTTKSYRIFVVGFALISFIVLANQAPVASQLNYVFRQISIVNQVFRDPFTKFIVPAIFVFAVGFSGGIALLTSIITTRIPRLRGKIFGITGSVILGSLIIIYMFPAFTGHMIAGRMKVEIPQYYFDFFTYMRQQDPTKRIADLPQGPIWGWMSTQWGYTGSGFWWHGLRQPVLNRAFDVWNSQSEEYYWEMVYALNKRDYVLFHNVLQKYDISYVMFDSSIYFPDNPNSVFTILRQKEFIDGDPALHKIETFGTIDLYETGITNNHSVSIVNNPPSVQTTTNWLGQDMAYTDFGNYLADQKGSSDTLYPFRSLFSGRGTSDILYHIVATPSAFIFQQDIPKGQLIFPKDISDEFIRFDPKTLQQTKSIPQIFNNDHTIFVASTSSVETGKLEIVLPKDSRYGSYDSSMQQTIGSEATCETGGKSADKQWNQSIVKDGDNSQYLRLDAVNARTCRIIVLQDFSHKLGYLVAVRSRNYMGDALSFWVENITEKRSDQQIYLGKQQSFTWEYFIIPPMDSDGVGYTLHFDNVSIGKQEAVNDLSEVIVYPIPYNFLTGMKVVSQDVPTQSNISLQAVTSVSHPVSSQYRITIDPTKLQEKDTIALYQTYDPGWDAYVVDGWLGNTFPTLFGKKLTKHVVVNNWANGWKIEGNPQTIILVFWPQYLEYFGFILLPIPFVYAFWPQRKKKE